MERHHFETELQTLKNRLLNMGALVEERVHLAVRALMERDPRAAENVSRHGPSGCPEAEGRANA